MEANYGTAAGNKNGDPPTGDGISSSGGTQLTPSQLRLQQMITMQHAQQREAQRRMSADGGPGAFTSGGSSRQGMQMSSLSTQGGGKQEGENGSSQEHQIQQQQQATAPVQGTDDMHYHSYYQKLAGEAIGAGGVQQPQEQRLEGTSGAPKSAITMGQGEMYFPVNVTHPHTQPQIQQQPSLQNPYAGTSGAGIESPLSQPGAGAPIASTGVRGGDVRLLRIDGNGTDENGDGTHQQNRAAVNPYSTYQMVDPDQNTMPPNIMGDPQNQQQQQMNLQALSDPNHQTHQFHYHNPDNPNYYENYPDPDRPHMGGFSVGGRRGKGSCITACFKSIFASIATAESLHRSFCFGAIDGMLTGSGIASACAGLGLVEPSSPLSTRLTILALTLAACSSDGICMAIGHIWSTYVLHSAALAERKEERENFDNNRADAKARLVDALLSRGMLKIDAMSVADTLEGYPDVFVSALVGDAGGHTLGSGPESEGGGLNGTGSSSGLLNPEDGDFGHGHYPVPHTHPGGGSRMGRTSDYHHGSYGQFDEYKEDPDKHILDTAIVDSEKEGFIMMLSFCMFSVIPGAIYVFVPAYVNSLGVGGTGISASSLSISITSVIMLLLGIWKSKFFDSSWMVFGIETVMVLLLCIMSAYGIGYGLASAIGTPSIGTSTM